MLGKRREVERPRVTSTVCRQHSQVDCESLAALFNHQDALVPSVSGAGRLSALGLFHTGRRPSPVPTLPWRHLQSPSEVNCRCLFF
jgi:hypothetical protein